MGAVVLFAPVVRRRYDPLAALAVAAAAIILLDPDVLADAGFQLSFLSMWGITTFASPITSLLGKIRLPDLLFYPLATSLSAQTATLPLSILLYGQVSIVSPIATLVADTTLSPLMLSGIATVSRPSAVVRLFVAGRPARLAVSRLAHLVGRMVGAIPLCGHSGTRLPTTIRPRLLRSPLRGCMALFQGKTQRATNRIRAPLQSGCPGRPSRRCLGGGGAACCSPVDTGYLRLQLLGEKYHWQSDLEKPRVMYNRNESPL